MSGPLDSENCGALYIVGYVLNKQEFRDAINLRYNWTIHDMPQYCACKAKNSIIHCLSCKKGRYVNLRHNSLRYGIANIMKEVCKDVRTEPALLPVELNCFSNSCTTSADGARLDISVCGLRSTFEYTYFLKTNY